MTGKRVVLTAQQLKGIPGHSTRKDDTQLQGMVAGLLYEAGVRNYFIGQKEGRDMLFFELTLDTDQPDTVRVIHFKIEIPQVYQAIKGKPDKHLPSVGWRLFHDYLDRKMAMVRLGVTDLMEEFTANIVMRLPGGGEGTLADVLRQSIENPDQAMLPFIQTREATA